MSIIDKQSKKKTFLNQLFIINKRHNQSKIGPISVQSEEKAKNRLQKQDELGIHNPVCVCVYVVCMHCASGMDMVFKF